MPIEIGMWRVNKNVERVNFSPIESEKKLEDILEKDISLISEDYILIGRQVLTSFGKLIDILAIDSEGNLQVIELKKNKTPRDVVAQIIDYASWVQNLSYSEILNIYEDKNNKKLEEAFDEKFGFNLPDKFNSLPNLIIVASEMDSHTERIISYLSENYDVPINIVFFRYFTDNNNEYIVRSWLINPNEVEVKASNSKRQKKSEPWNGKDFVFTLGENNSRNWEDCIEYGYVSAGGGTWYSKSLNALEEGHRIFCMIPKLGYVGVGVVKAKAVPVTDFLVEVDGEKKHIYELSLKATEITKDKDDKDSCEYLVKIDWDKTVDRSKAYWEKGLVANQNSAFKLRNKFTLEKLLTHFKLDE